MEEYKQENIELIKKYLKELQKLDYEKLDLTTAITLEHRLYYDIYLPFKKIVEEIKE